MNRRLWNAWHNIVVHPLAGVCWLVGLEAWGDWLHGADERPAPNEHLWCDGPLKCCVRCEAWQGQESGRQPCDPSKLAGKVEPCCECGDDYPRSDLLAGHVFCPKCREAT